MRPETGKETEAPRRKTAACFDKRENEREIMTTSARPPGSRYLLQIFSAMARENSLTICFLSLQFPGQGSNTFRRLYAGSRPSSRGVEGCGRAGNRRAICGAFAHAGLSVADI
jgi:hypothetical protein